MKKKSCDQCTKKFKLPNMSEKFCLKWNDFTSNVSKSFGLLRTAEYLHDVTLVADDHKQVSAHKLVLSACSEYFKDIFKNNNNKLSHPILCLDGISSADLENILGYIYNGEIQIYHEHLDRFLGIAQRFKLEGLLSDNNSDLENQEAEGIETYLTKYENPGEEYVPQLDMKTKPVRSQASSSRDVALMEKVPVSTEEMDDIRNKTNELLERCDNGRYRCILCGKTSNGTSAQSRQQIQYHIEANHLEGISFPCQLCEESFRSRNALKCHKYAFHK